MSKRSERLKKMEEVRKKQLKIAWEYPFCRRCRVKLDKKWSAKLKRKGSMPLCETCYPVMMKQYAALQELWAKFNRR